MMVVGLGSGRHARGGARRSLKRPARCGWSLAAQLERRHGQVVAAVPEGQHAAAVVSRMLWKFSGDVLRACEGSVFQAARSRGIGSGG